MTTATPTKTTTPKIDLGFIDIEVNNHELLKLAYNSYLAGLREVSAQTKTRGLVRGGGAKPWRQKGTGRARTGSIRNPIWRGGGIVFGPSGNENYSINLSTKQKRHALKQALSLAKKEGIIKVVDKIDIKDGKTKSAIKFLKDQKADRTTLIVVEKKTPELMRSTANIKGIHIIKSSHLTTFHVLNAFHIIFDEKGLETLKHRLSNGDAK